jgi:16S rRNA processing protein RimM
MSGRNNGPAGSPTAGEPAFLAVGKLRRPHGVQGEALVELFSDFPERLRPKATLYVGEAHIPLTVRSQRNHQQGLLLAFEGFASPESIGRFRNQMLYVSIQDVHNLPEGEFYYHELLGLQVEDETGALLGTLTEILETGANDVYVIEDASGAEILVPAIPDVVLNIDVEVGKMKVHLLPGLTEEG